MTLINSNGKLWDTDAAVGRAVFFHSAGPLPVRSAIARVTRTQFVLAGGQHVRRRDGVLVGNRWSRAWMPTAEQEQAAEDQYEARDLARALRHADWTKVPVADLRAIWTLVAKSVLPSVRNDDGVVGSGRAL